MLYKIVGQDGATLARVEADLVRCDENAIYLYAVGRPRMAADAVAVIPLVSGYFVCEAQEQSGDTDNSTIRPAPGVDPKKGGIMDCGEDGTIVWDEVRPLATHEVRHDSTGSDNVNRFNCYEANQ